MSTFEDIYNPNRHYLPPGIYFERGNNHTLFVPTWKGQFLFIALDSPDTELEEKYKNAIANHNSNVDNCFPDSGFDLFLPTEFSPEIKTEKIDYKIKAAMFKTMESCKVETANQNAITFNNREPMPYYLYPRSSISKTRVRLANNVGIIDSGYRGNLMASFYNTKDTDVIIKKGDRIVQICMPSLEKNFLIDIKITLDSTARGEGGLGSTGK